MPQTVRRLATKDYINTYYSAESFNLDTLSACSLSLCCGWTLLDRTILVVLLLPGTKQTSGLQESSGLLSRTLTR